MMIKTPKQVLIIGGSGFIGTKLADALLERGSHVVIADLVPPRVIDPRVIFHKVNFIEDTIDPSIFEGCDAVINLAGAPISKRWTREYKKVMYASRIMTTRKIVALLGQLETKPHVLVNASASGFYGDCKEVLLSEDHVCGADFLAELCRDWEAEALKAESFGVRVVCVRTANVLGPGGLLTTLTPLFKKGLGGYFGSGAQRMPWIHWRDIVRVYLFALDREIAGPVNVGAGNTPTQKELFRALQKSIHAPFLWRIPYFVARIVIGEFAEALVGSQNTDSQKLRDAGFVHEFSNSDQALDDIVRASSS
ncbi:MAG: TIGR01777 family oxidoreductase [bacterium]